MSYTYTQAINPKWADANQTGIELDVDFDHLEDGLVPFLASPEDPEPHGREIYARAVAGDFGEVAAYTPPPDLTGEDALVELRQKRDRLLADSDVYVLPDRWATMTTEKQTEWSDYRQSLRDLPENSLQVTVSWVEYNGYTNWSNVNWPTKPGA